MKNEKTCPFPFIEKFSDNGFFFIYDVNTNQIVEVDQVIYEIIDSYDENQLDTLETQFNQVYGPAVTQHSLDEIKKAITQYGLFSNFRPEKITMGIRNIEDIKEIHNHGLKQLVLELTRDCNLNCSYCQTSGKYASRAHSPMHMPASTCQDAVDFFCERTAPGEEAYITFYGGEPLLQFTLMKDTVDYVKKKVNSHQYKFNLTTNGTLLTQEHLDFFIRNDFSVMVSLDGPELINNRYRVFKDGTGTFNRIINTLDFIKSVDKDYFTRNVSISSVFSPPYDQVTTLIDFFSTHPTLHEIKEKTRLSAVNTAGCTFLEDFGLTKSIKDINSAEEIFISRLRQAILSGDINLLTIEKKKVYSVLFNLSRRPIKQLYPYVQPLGACHIGLRRLFVDVDGRFNICERVPGCYQVGSVDRGFDYPRIVNYYQEFDLLINNCKECWALNHCERCWAIIGDLEKFSGKTKEEFCANNQKTIKKAFTLYTRLIKENPECLKVFKEVTIA